MNASPENGKKKAVSVTGGDTGSKNFFKLRLFRGLCVFETVMR
jgi:hypothetical protein